MGNADFSTTSGPSPADGPLVEIKDSCGVSVRSVGNVGHPTSPPAALTCVKYVLPVTLGRNNPGTLAARALSSLLGVLSFSSFMLLLALHHALCWFRRISLINAMVSSGECPFERYWRSYRTRTIRRAAWFPVPN